ncbi:MAG: O-antigen ligase family protein [Bacteroidota bacterium]
MQKPIQKSAKTQIKNTTLPPLKYSYIILLLSYALITIITPRFETYDSNAPKFLALSLLNLFSFLFLFSEKTFRTDQGLSLSFFKNKIGLAYTLFIALILVSFTKAINLPESILSFSKYFTVFSAVYVISILLRVDKRYFRILVIVMVFVLISDSLTVFYNILLYISKQVNTISDIKSIYSNKNMLAAAIFIKISFALWLLTFEKAWLRKLGYFSLFCAELAIFFMSTRAFYLGITFLALIYMVFMLILNIRNKVNNIYRTPAYFLGILILAFSLFTITQHYLYPQNTDTYNVSVTKRLSTITDKEASSMFRLESWKRSALLFKQDPLLGVGTGNWKIRILQYENPEKSDFTFMVKAHNDFVEIATETGVFGGLLFISLFIFLVLNFVKAFFRSQTDEKSLSLLFLPAFGIICYTFDAFFNFPADRPEIQSLFALLIGAGIAYSPNSFLSSKSIHPWFLRFLSLMLIALLIVTCYVLQINTQCLKLQRLYQTDGVLGKFTHASSIFVKGYPSLLNVSSVGDPIAVIKSQYLMNEEKYQDAINFLRPDKSSPYDGRREHLLAKAYSKLGNNDSALVFAYRAYALKPRLYEPLGFICYMLNNQGKKEEAIKMTEKFLVIEKFNALAWMDISSIYKKSGDYLKAIQSIDTAAKYLPGDSSILLQQTELKMYAGIVPYQQTYATAMKYFDQQKFAEALKYLNAIPGKEENLCMVYARRAVCYFYAKDYQKCILDVNRSIAGGNDTPDLLNIRGASYHVLGKVNEACVDFQNAADRGNKDAAMNAQRLCKGR